MFDHTADIGLEIVGRTRKELFAGAAWALTDVLVGHPDKQTRQGKQRTITLEGTDTADLLINFLREILYLFNGKGLTIRNCEISECGNTSLSARLILEPLSKKKHTVKLEIKAVTYHGLSVAREKSGWRARVIFDV